MFCTDFQGHRNLSQLPNFAFSVALAYFHFSRKQGSTEKADEMVSFFVNYTYTGVISQRLDTDVHSVLIAKTSTAL